MANRRRKRTKHRKQVQQLRKALESAQQQLGHKCSQQHRLHNQLLVWQVAAASLVLTLLLTVLPR